MLTPWTNSFWKGGLSEAELRATARQVEEEAWSAQKEAGIQRIALDGTWYDSVLDMIFALGLIPKRFRVSLACTAQPQDHSESSLGLLWKST